MTTIPESPSAVLITGASSGIGRALAIEYAMRGANLALVARREAQLAQLKQEILHLAPDCSVVIARADVSNEADLRSAIARTRTALGPFDTVVANAGFGVVGILETLSNADLQRQFNVNVFGALNTLRAVLDDLKATHGRLCLIGSVCAYLTPPGSAAYSMSKYAVRSLAEGLHAELAPYGISVTLINPGFIETEIRLVGNDGTSGPAVPSTKDPVPSWLMMSAETAARKIATAIQKRKRERALTIHGHLLIWIARFLPGVLAALLKKTVKIQKSSPPAPV